MSDDSDCEIRVAAVLRCRLGQSGLQLAFESVAATLSSRLEDEGELDLSVQIPSLERLFSAFRESAVTTTVGLWAELALIAEARDVVAAAEAWHGDPRATFDFRTPGNAIEVKASRDAARSHWFSLGQRRAAEFVRCEVASLVVPALDTGVSVADLLEQIGERLTGRAPLQHKVLEVAVRTLGSDFGGASLERFDLDAARASLRFVPLTSIPCGTFEPGVLDARWRVSLEHLGGDAVADWVALSPAQS